MGVLGSQFIVNFRRGERVLAATRQQWVLSLQSEYGRNKLLTETMPLMFPASLQGTYKTMLAGMETILSRKLREEVSYLVPDLAKAPLPEYNRLVRDLGEPYSAYMATVEEDWGCVQVFLTTVTSACGFCRNPAECPKCLQLIHLHLHLEKENLKFLAEAFDTFLVNITFCCCFDSQ